MLDPNLIDNPRARAVAGSVVPVGRSTSPWLEALAWLVRAGIVALAMLGVSL